MKILIVHASSGLGHTKAAEAIYEEFSKRSESFQIYLENILEYTHPIFRFFYSQFYLYLIKNLRLVWGCLFYATDIKHINNLATWIRCYFERICSKSFQKYLTDNNFDLIISTHFTSSYIAGFLKENKKITSKIITVVTDYRAHAVWFAEQSDYFIVACGKTKEDLQNNQINPSNIKIMGIPVCREFLKDKNKQKLYEKLELKSSKFTVMIISSSVGAGPYKYFMRKFSKLQDKINILFVCGNNKKLYNKLKKISSNLNTTFKIYGFIDNVDELMRVSDIVVTKAGGISLTEALVLQTAIIAVNPIPGQEKLNSDLFADLNIAKTAKNKEEAFEFINWLIDHPEGLKSMKDNSKQLAKADAAKEVVRFAKRIA